MSAEQRHARALAPPTGDLALLDRRVAEAALSHSRASPRRRVIAPFHRSGADMLQRMFNAVQPDSYLRPHRHLDPPKAEAFVVLRGALAFLTFEDDGRVRDCVHVEAGGEVFGVDLLPGVYHSFIALSPDTLVYEVKDGPYAPATDKSFAPWAPAEGAPEAAAYLERLRAEAAHRFRPQGR